jgi:signal transduction histidine kinase
VLGRDPAATGKGTEKSPANAHAPARIALLRPLVAKLRPKTPETTGLRISLEIHHDRVYEPYALARRSAMPVDLEVDLDGPLPEEVEVAAYYVVSEALANVAKHAAATSACVEADRKDGVLRISVRDNGVGGADPTRGTGLLGLRDRVEAIGGTMSVDSARGTGTSITVFLPLASEPEHDGDHTTRSSQRLPGEEAAALQAE